MKALKDNTLRSKHVILAFTLTALIDMVSVSLNLYQNSVLKGYEIGTYNSDRINLLDNITIALGIIQFIIFVTTIVLFIKWFRRAYGNLIRLNVSMAYSENSAIWGYFIPIINWVRPIKTMKEIFLKTQQTIKAYSSNIQMDQNTGFITLWWIIYLINGGVANVASKQMNRADTIDAFIEANNIYVFSDLLDLLAIGLAIYVVQRIAKLELILIKTDTSLSLIDQIGSNPEI